MASGIGTGSACNAPKYGGGLAQDGCTHNGTDFCAVSCEEIFAPIADVVHIGYPYANSL